MNHDDESYRFGHPKYNTPVCIVSIKVCQRRFADFQSPQVYPADNTELWHIAFTDILEFMQCLRNLRFLVENPGIDRYDENDGVTEHELNSIYADLLVNSSANILPVEYHFWNSRGENKTFFVLQPDLWDEFYHTKTASFQAFLGPQGDTRVYRFSTRFRNYKYSYDLDKNTDGRHTHYKTAWKQADAYGFRGSAAELAHASAYATATNREICRGRENTIAHIGTIRPSDVYDVFNIEVSFHNYLPARILYKLFDDEASLDRTRVRNYFADLCAFNYQYRNGISNTLLPYFYRFLPWEHYYFEIEDEMRKFYSAVGRRTNTVRSVPVRGLRRQVLRHEDRVYSAVERPHHVFSMDVYYVMPFEYVAKFVYSHVPQQSLPVVMTTKWTL